jgi:hypothetical protein
MLVNREHGWKGAYMKWSRIAIAQFRHAYVLLQFTTQQQSNSRLQAIGTH